jgi:hypothetical protein
MPVRMSVEEEKVLAAIGAEPPQSYTAKPNDGALVWLPAHVFYDVLTLDGSDLSVSYFDKVQLLLGYRIESIGHIELMDDNYSFSLRRNLAGLWTVWLDVNENAQIEDELLERIKVLFAP